MANVEMIERSNGSRFLFKATQPLAVSGERLRSNFQRDIAPLPGVESAIHLLIPPAPGGDWIS